MMLDRVRWRLSVLYTLAAVLMLTSVGLGGYTLLARYLYGTTDRALLQRMALEFSYLDAPLPGGLALEAPRTPQNHQNMADISATFVLPLDATGAVLYDPNPWQAPIAPNQDAVLMAITGTRDWRTVVAPDGSRVRLLTERLTRDDGPAVLQVGRSLREQDALLRQALIVVGLLGLASTIVVGWASWWLAGRSVRPAQAAWERQQAFIANASHELRAPLTLLRASAEVVLRGLPDDHADRPLLDDIVAEADHMTKLVEDLLLLSRLDTQQIQLAPELIDATSLTELLERQLAPLAAQRQIRFDWHLADTVVFADRLRLRQVLLVVVDNAFQHTPPDGRITISSKRHSNTTQLLIHNTGTEIAPQHLEHLFERFYRIDSTRRDGSSGTGLGLSIAQALIEAHHGTIAITSPSGQGTTITITLPLPAHPPAMAHE